MVADIEVYHHGVVIVQHIAKDPVNAVCGKLLSPWVSINTAPGVTLSYRLCEDCRILSRVKKEEE